HASGERDVRRELHEAEAEVAIEDVEVVLVHEHVASIKREARRFAVGRRPFAPAWPLLDDAEAADLLLRDADHHNAFVLLELGKVLVRDLLLRRALLEAHDLELMLFRERMNLRDERVAQLL